MDSLPDNLNEIASEKGFVLIAKHPTELYHLDTSDITYTNTSTRDLELVLYLKAPIYRPGKLVIFSKMTFYQARLVKLILS